MEVIKLSILHLLASDNFITVNRSIADVVGLDGAIVLGELVSEHFYWQGRDELNDGYFFSTVENLEKKTYLSAHNQRIALDKLKESGMIDVVKKGMPAKRYIRINEDKITDIVNNKSLKILTTSDQNFEPQVVKNFNSNKNIDNKNKEEEKKNNNISVVYRECLEQVPVIVNNPDLMDAFMGFIEMRKKIKSPPTERALKMIVNEAYKLGHGDADKMKAIVDQSTMNGWKDVYPLRNKGNGSGSSEVSNNPFTEILRQEGIE